MADIVNPGQEAGTPLNAGALPANKDLVIYKGDYVRFLVNIVDSVGTPVVLTGYVPSAVLRSDYTDRDAKPFECTLTGSPGQVMVHMPSSVTASLLPGSYIYDLQVTSPIGATRTYLTGDVTVYNEVTN